ncbi:hypothetical protein [Actinoplanes auranticolor]|uniref:hypothetical protein n=1 Tax=Actinoplanes auranticolor TaxID=47988 RepID=UPI001BB3380A|nr:hypothetical protein [Actinoplanes auranticolor]
MGTAAEPPAAAAEPLEPGASEGPAELLGVAGELPELLGAAGELPELLGAAAVPVELPEPKTEPAGLAARAAGDSGPPALPEAEPLTVPGAEVEPPDGPEAEPLTVPGAEVEPPDGPEAEPLTVPGAEVEPPDGPEAEPLTGPEAEVEPPDGPEAEPLTVPGAEAEPPDGPETGAEPETEARPLVEPLTGTALIGAEPTEAEPTGAEPAEGEPAGVELTGADADARALGAVPEEAGFAASLPDAGAHSAPGAGGGGNAYPWSLFGPALLAGGRAAGGVLPSLSGFACCSSMGPPDRRHPRVDATCRTPGRPMCRALGNYRATSALMSAPGVGRSPA